MHGFWRCRSDDFENRLFPGCKAHAESRRALLVVQTIPGSLERWCYLGFGLIGASGKICKFLRVQQRANVWFGVDQFFRSTAPQTDLSMVQI